MSMTDLVPITITVSGEAIIIPPVAPDIDDLAPDTPIQEWAGNLIRTSQDEQNSQFNHCWYLAFGEQQYGEAVHQYLGLLPDAPGTLANKATLGRCITKSRLRDWDDKGYRRLAMSSYMEFCAVPEARRDELMAKVQEKDWKREDIRDWKRRQGITTPRSPFEYQLENDQLQAENAINGREIEKLRTENEELGARLAAVPAVCPDCGWGGWRK
jgi:hypothetical protein